MAWVGFVAAVVVVDATVVDSVVDSVGAAVDAGATVTVLGGGVITVRPTVVSVSKAAVVEAVVGSGGDVTVVLSVTTGGICVVVVGMESMVSGVVVVIVGSVESVVVVMISGISVAFVLVAVVTVGLVFSVEDGASVLGFESQSLIGVGRGLKSLPGKSRSMVAPSIGIMTVVSCPSHLGSSLSRQLMSIPP